MTYFWKSWIDKWKIHAVSFGPMSDTTFYMNLKLKWIDEIGDIFDGQRGKNYIELFDSGNVFFFVENKV